MDEKRKLGPNMRSLVIRKVARDAIPSGGGFADGVEFLMNPEKVAATHREALAWADQAIAVMKTAPDNPYGDDEEVIAGAILKAIAEATLTIIADRK